MTTHEIPARPAKTRCHAHHRSYFDLLVAALLFPQAAAGQIAFEEVTETAGVSNPIPQSYGASWGNLNGDGRPDLFTLGHRTADTARLHLNDGDGTFTDVLHQYLNFVDEDQHGSAWADFDNDGDQDILQMGGGGSGGRFDPTANELFVNEDGMLVDEAGARGIDYPDGRGRTPLWFDWNGDGELDVLLANWERSDGMYPSALFTQHDGIFVEDNAITGFATSRSNAFVQLTYLTTETFPALVVHAATYPDRVYRTDTLPFLDVTESSGLGSTSKVQDVAIADFNGDLLADFFLVRGEAASAVEQPDPFSVKARLVVEVDERGFSFSANGSIVFEVGPSASITPTDIYIGTTGFNPTTHAIALDSADANVIGLLQHSPGKDFGLYIGIDAETNQWQVFASKESWLNFNVTITAEAEITGLATIGFGSAGGVLPHRLLMQTADGFEDVSPADHLELPSFCTSVAAADFDNDTDVDVYLVCGGPLQTGQTTPIVNLPNVMYENLGNGDFLVVPDSGGAPGTAIGGAGDAVAVADFDEDGFPDLFVTNGQGKGGLGKRGPDQLYRNLGNTNHWIEIDLEGVASNRDGVGARVFVTTRIGTQVRTQNGGMHRHTQNHQRVHFGLGRIRRIREIVVEWPSGVVQSLSRIRADQILHIVEPSVP